MEKLTDIIPADAARAATKKGRKLERLYQVMVFGGADHREKNKVLEIRRCYIDRTGKVEKEDIEFMNEMWHKYKGQGLNERIK